MQTNEANETSTLSVSIIEYALASTLYALHFMFNIVGNSLLLYTYATVREIRSQHHLVAAIAVVDLIAGLSYIHRSMVPIFGLHALSKFTCAIIDTPQTFGAAADSLLTLCSAVYRYVGFRYPQKFPILVSTPALILLYGTVGAYFVMFETWVLLTSDPDKTVVVCLAAGLGSKNARRAAGGVSVLITLATIIVNFLLFGFVRSKMKGRQFDKDRDKRLAESIMLISLVNITVSLFAYTQFMIVQVTMSPDRAQLYNFFRGGFIFPITFSANYWIYLARCSDYRKLFRTKTMVHTLAGRSDIGDPRNSQIPRRKLSELTDAYEKD